MSDRETAQAEGRGHLVFCRVPMSETRRTDMTADLPFVPVSLRCLRTCQPSIDAADAVRRG